MAELITWCRLMRIGPTCAVPCDDCRITSSKFAKAGITLDPARFYDAPPTTKETPMQTNAIAHVAAVAKRDRSLSIFSSNITVASLEAAVAEHRRLVDAFGRLAVVAGRLDFDRSESGLPQTEEQWIEFVRSVEESAAKIVDEVGDLA
jgi:hypothetical protein